MLDPDFGWHVRMGQEILMSGIPLHDPFSYTMMSYPFVDHEWLTNVVMFFLYKNGGMFAASIFFSAALFLTMWILLKNGKCKVPEIFLLIAASLLGFGGVRPQVLGWLFFVMWMRELLKTKHNNGLLLFLQLLWANLHGSFFLGLSSYILFWGIEQINKKSKKSSLVMCVALFVVTLINPYTYRIWWEVFMQLTDGSLRWRIMEWIPGVLVFDISFWIYVCIFLSLFIKFRNKIGLFQKMITTIFFLMALSTARNMPLFLLVSSSSFLILWGAFEKSIPIQKKEASLFFKKTIVGICVFVSVVSVCLTILSYKPIHKVYPVDAVNYLRRNQLNGNIFSLYEWGGYIIWKSPENKVFVDGRMPSWRWKQDDPHQSNNADSEYRAIFKTKNGFDYYKQKYAIKYVLIGKEKDRQLLFKKYKKIYEDETATLYKL